MRPSSERSISGDNDSNAPIHCRRIVLMGIDMNDFDNDSYFWSYVRALNDLGHSITVIRNRGMSKRAVRQINFPHLNIGTWIPRTVWGYFRSFMYAVRSVYTALWVSRYCQTNVAEFEPTLVISDASVVALPILRQYGGFQVICMQYFRELLAEFEPYNSVRSVISPFLAPLRRMCLSSADLILVPCKSARELLNLCESDERVSILYPPAEGEYSTNRYEAEHFDVRRIPVYGNNNYVRRRGQVLPHPVELEVYSRFVFVVTGVYEPRSNFHVLIDAFEMVLEQFDYVRQQRLRLEIVGSCSTDAQRAYRRELLQQVARLGIRISPRITLHSNVPFEQRCSLYRGCCAVLNANVIDLYVPSIIEGFYFARVIITGESEFASEVIQHGITGIIVEQPYDPDLYADKFANSILNMLHHVGPTYKFIAMAASYEYDDVYSFQNFLSRVHQFILTLSDNADLDL